MKLSSPAARVIASVLVVLQVALLPAAAAAEVARGVGTSTPIAAPRVEVNRSALALRPQPSEPSFSADPSDGEIFRARVFDEPFVPVARAQQGSENIDLARVIRDHARSNTPDDVTGFEVFLRDHPSSRWSGAVLLGLGLVYRQTGYLTRALERFERAWTVLEKETEPRAKALGDRAVAELADLNARLGRAERVETLFAAARTRDMRGPAAEKFAATENVVAAARLEVRRAFRCGPMALERALSTGTLTDAARQRILKEGSTEKGTSLSQLLRLSQEIDVPMQMAWREPAAEVITPAVVHWKSGHFAAITADDGRRSRVDDPVLGGQMSVSRPALDEEASGAFLVPVGQMPNGWRLLSGAEGDLFWGRGETSGPDQKVYGCSRKSSGGGSCSSGHCPMADYKVNLLLVNLHVSDSPVGYDPPVGPSMRFTLAYNQREYFQPQLPSYSNFGPKWTFGWFSYVEDTPTDPNQSPNVYLQLGGVETYFNYDAGSQTYGTHYSSRAVLARTSSTSYERRLPDGSVEIFAQPDGSTVYPRRVFLTAIRDPQGNQVNFGYTYDAPTGALLLSSATDKIGQVTTFQYGGSDPRKITRVTDPFGRYASFEYDPSGRLSRITDVIGITSEFTYGTTDFISSLTTPYGTTTFQTGMSATGRWLEATDALAAKERFEYLGVTGIASSEPTAVVPSGVAVQNIYIHARNTFYWDKRAMASMPYSIDYRKARITHWLHSYFNNLESSGTIESEKAPLENRIWYNYPDNQGAPAFEGTSTNPTIAARVLDDGTTQLYRYEYNSRGLKTKEIDPVGRETVFVYGNSNTPDPDPVTGTGMDLLQVKQKNGSNYELLTSYTYNNQHQPLTKTDVAGQTTTYTYNAQGQILTVTTPARAGITEDRTTTSSYDPNGYLQSITGPVAGDVTSYTYDGYGRVRTTTDADNFTVTFDYDALDRLTRATYPDGTTEETAYNRLDAERQKDRLGRWTHRFHDALRRVVAMRDAAGRTTTYQWCTCGSLDKIIDGNNHANTWERDLQGRITRAVRPDNAAWEYTYENTTSRLKQQKDPKNQTVNYEYFLDDTFKQVSYTNAVVPTSNVSFTYDAIYNRRATMTDGMGTTTWTYYPIPSPATLGAGRLASIDGPLANDAVTYTYDELTRIVSRGLPGFISTFTYDTLGRLSAQSGPLGSFSYTFDGPTLRVLSESLPNGQTSQYAYFPNSGDRRLQEMTHLAPGGGLLNKYTYTYDAASNVKTWMQQVGGDTAKVFDLSYDPADELTSATFKTTDPTPVTLKRYGYAYDPGGNRIANQVDDSVLGATFNSRNELVSEQAGGALLFRGTVNEASTVMVQGKPASVTVDNRFEGRADVASGTNTVAVTATDASGNTRTNTYEVGVAGSGMTYTYDLNGNLTGDGTRTFEWDAENRLTRVVSGGNEVVRFKYDGLGHRVEKVASGVTHTYVYEGIHVAEERLSTGGAVRYFHGPAVDDWLGRQEADGSPTYFVVDHLGSVVRHTNGLGQATLTRTYDPWGQLDTSSAAVSGLAFSGREWDPEDGLYYFRARNLNPATGRFLSEDPISSHDPAQLLNMATGELEGPNLYEYVRNNPVRLIDPTGELSAPSWVPNWIPTWWQRTAPARRTWWIIKATRCSVTYEQCINEADAYCNANFPPGSFWPARAGCFSRRDCCFGQWLKCVKPFAPLYCPPKWKSCTEPRP